MGRISQKYIAIIVISLILIAGITLLQRSSSNAQQWSGQVENITYWENGEMYVIDNRYDRYPELKRTLVQALANYGGRLQENNMEPCFSRFRNETAVEITFNEPIHYTEPPYNGSSRSFIFRLDSEPKIHPGCSAFVSDMKWQDNVEDMLVQMGLMDDWDAAIKEHTEKRPRREGPFNYTAEDRITDDPQNYYNYTDYPDSYHSYYTYRMSLTLHPRTTDTATLNNFTLYLPVPAADDMLLTDDILADTDSSSQYGRELLNLSLVNISKGTMFAVRLDNVSLPSEQGFMRLVEPIWANRSINTVDPLRNEPSFQPANYTNRSLTVPVYVNYTGPAVDVQIMTSFSGTNEWGDASRWFQRVYFNSYEQTISGETVSQRGWTTVTGRFNPAAGMYPEQHCTLQHRACTCYGGLGTADENTEGVACAGETECRIETEQIC